MQPPQSRSQPPISVDLTMTLVVLIWGANLSVLKAAIGQIAPFAFTAIRFTLASGVLWGILRLSEGAHPLSRATLLRSVWLGLAGNTLYQTFFISGLRRTSVANSALLLATTPVIVALASALLGLERVTRRIAWGIALAFLGVGLIVVRRGLALSSETLGGDLLVLAAAGCWAIYTLGVRTVARELSPLRTTTLTMLTGTPGLILAGAPELSWQDWSAVGFAGWFGLGYSATLGLVLAYILWNNSVRVVGSSRTAVYVCATPLVAMLVAWAVLGERPTGLRAVGAALIVGGVLLTRR